MPTYRYEVIQPDGSAGEQFEVVQAMSEAALTVHPETGEPIRRVFLPPNIGGSHSEASEKSRLSDSNLERMGFTKYERSGSGTFEKRVGSGPSSISAD